MSGEDAAPVIRLAESIFPRVTTIRPAKPTPEGWPFAQNYVFETAVRWTFENGKEPFLWLETDAIPLKASWLDKIAGEYLASKMPFMGVIAEKPWPHMTGTGVWPGESQVAARDIFSAGSNAFDNMVRPEHIKGKFHQTPLIQHVWDLIPFQDQSSVQQRVSPHAVIYHRNKDGALIRRLREAKTGVRSPEPVAVVEPEQKAAPLPKLAEQSVPLPKSVPAAEAFPMPPVVDDPADKFTVVITAHNRPTHLQACVASCIDAGIKNIVITATGLTGALRKVLRGLSDKAKIIQNGARVTSNDAWLAGIRAAQTEKVMILHDDDLLLKDYLKYVGPHLHQPFILYSAVFHKVGKGQVAGTLAIEIKTHGTRPTDELRLILSTPGSGTITPVRGVFNKKDLVKWLIEAGASLPSECDYRPRFLVGNDLWIWLRACESYHVFESVPMPLVSLGCDDTSTTCHDKASEGENRLGGIYDLTRETFHKTVCCNPARKHPQPEVREHAESEAAVISGIEVRGGKDMVLVSPIGTNGYAHITKIRMCELLNEGWNLFWMPMKVDDSIQDPSLTDIIHKGLERPPPSRYDVLRVIATPDTWPKYTHLSSASHRFVGETIWETSKIIPRWVQICNSVPDEIVVPTHWNADVFSECGVTTAITVSPYQPPEECLPLRDDVNISGVRSGDYVFYTIGQWTHRKGIAETLQAFCSEFRSHEPVAFVIKAFWTGYSETDKKQIRDWTAEILNRYHDHARVVLLVDNYSRREILGLHSLGDCYISLCRSEGWGLGAYDAHAHDREVIITGWGGQRQFLGEDHSYYVDYTMEAVSGMPWIDVYTSDQQWASPDIAHARQLMRKVFDERAWNDSKERKPVVVEDTTLANEVV
ncbi:MAG: glycosyltransferase [Phycisphaerae bacterium]